MVGEIFGNSDHHEVSGALWVITIGHLGCVQVFNQTSCHILVLQTHLGVSAQSAGGARGESCLPPMELIFHASGQSVCPSCALFAWELGITVSEMLCSSQPRR